MYTYVAKGRTRYRCIGRLKALQAGTESTCYGVSIAGEGMEQYVTDRFLTSFGALPVVRMVEHAGEDFRPQIRQAKEALDDLEKDRYDRGLFKGEEGAARYAAQYAKLEERLASLNERQRTAKPAGVEAVPTGRLFEQHWKDADTAGKRDLLLDAGTYVEVGMSRKGGPKLDTSRLAVHFGEDGEIRRADADGKDVEAVIQRAVAREVELHGG
jgi:site-specific DNA recombinase